MGYLPLIAQKQLRLVNTTLCQHATPCVFKRVVVPKTAGRSTREIPKSLIANNTTSITILKKEVDPQLLVGATNQTHTSPISGNVQNATKEPFNVKKKPPPAFTTSFIQELFTDIPLVDEVCIQHPVSLNNLQIILNNIGTRLRSLYIIGEAFKVTARKENGLQFLATSAATIELERLRLTPIGSFSKLDEAEECAIATLIGRSSATLRCLDLGWASPVALAALGDCRTLTTLNLNGHECANMLPSLLANNPGLKILCLQRTNIADEPADGNLARAFFTFKGTLDRLEITCVSSVPNWLYSASCLNSLSVLVIQTKEAGDVFVDWIADLNKLRRIEFIGVKFESNVNYTSCLPHATTLQLSHCELSFNSLSQLVCSTSALASLSFSKVILIDNDDHTEFDYINANLDQPAVQIFGRKFAAATTPPERNDITMRLALRSKHDVSDDQPVPLHLQQKWLESRSQEDADTQFTVTGLLSTDDEFGISSGSDQSASSSLDVDGLANQSQVQGDSLAGEEENSSSSSSSLISVSHDFVTDDSQKGSEIGPLEQRQCESLLQDISNKRDRTIFSGTESGDGERSDKRPRSESKSISPPSPPRKNCPSRRERGWVDENERE